LEMNTVIFPYFKDKILNDFTNFGQKIFILHTAVRWLGLYHLESSTVSMQH
jgi:hypothetical protein